MKRTILTASVSVWALLAQGQATNNYVLTPGVGIPAGNPVGLTEEFSVGGLTGETITNVQVALDITGGFNGNLYAYLVSPNGSFAVLLNRVGVSASNPNPFGYGDTGFDIVLDDSGANIHAYQGGSYSLNGSGQLEGTWAPDGRNIDPGSSGGAFDSASTTANFANFLGSNPNGTWTLFIADLVSGGGTPTLSSVTLTIMTVPEPPALALTGLGLAGALLLLFRRVSSNG